MRDYNDDHYHKRAMTKPLSKNELRDMAKANVFIMDWEMDGGTLPPAVESISNLRRNLKPDEQRIILDWFYSTAPGNY